jgi:serine/threonine protein phosphatase PrpC
MAETLDTSPYLSLAAATDRGRSRTRNEDAHLVDASAGLIVVGDGMGGHPAGDVASATAVEEVARQLRDPASPEALGGRMLQAVLRADARVRDVGSADPARHGMGTTVTALITPAGSGRVVIGHVGDSRAYVFERGTIRQLTRDHTWIEQQIATGALTRDEAHGHRWSHVLTQAAGAGDEIDPEVLELNAKPGQVYLLCTDGLTNMLTDLAIERTLEDTLSMGLEATAWALVDGANDRGGIDNITVALLRI